MIMSDKNKSYFYTCPTRNIEDEPSEDPEACDCIVYDNNWNVIDENLTPAEAQAAVADLMESVDRGYD